MDPELLLSAGYLVRDDWEEHLLGPGTLDPSNLQCSLLRICPWLTAAAIPGPTIDAYREVCRQVCRQGRVSEGWSSEAANAGGRHGGDPNAVIGRRAAITVRVPPARVAAPEKTPARERSAVYSARGGQLSGQWPREITAAAEGVSEGECRGLALVR